MTTHAGVAAGVQVLGGVALGPLLVGVVQSLKARLQGRRGPSPVQPYRELARLWRKSAIDVEGTTVAYRLAPVVVAAATTVAVLLVPVAAGAPALGAGHDALTLVFLLALARLALAVAAWDTANGFALQGSSRDLALSVTVDAALVLSLAVAALIGGTTDLAAMIAATAGTAPWSAPTLSLGTAAFLLVVVAETGRQPVDNPDTHLELTMVHEGMLLEYSGRPLALLTLAAQVKQIAMLGLVGALFLPWTVGAGIVGLLAYLARLGLLGLAMALIETSNAKLRILRLVDLLATAAALGGLSLVARAVFGG